MKFNLKFYFAIKLKIYYNLLHGRLVKDRLKLIQFRIIIANIMKQKNFSIAHDLFLRELRC